MRYKILRALLFLILAPLLLLLTFEGLSRDSLGEVFQWIVQSPLIFLCNAGLLLGLCLLFSIARSDRLRAGLTLGLGLVLALWGIANHYKLLYRLEPVLLSDITQIGDAAATLTGLDFQIDWAQILCVCAAFIAAIVLCCFFVKTRRAKRGFVLPVLGLALLLGLPPLCTFERAVGSVRTDMVDHAKNEGCLYATVAVENYRRAIMRVDYAEQEVREGYRSLAAQTPAASAVDAPNIVLVLCESFTDEAFLGQGLQLKETLMPFYSELCKQSATGRLYVPKVGGGTSETEFEVLTGLRSQYAVNPYAMGLPPLCSIATVLRGHGYEAATIHWYTGVYYNRYQNLKMEGFDAFYTTDTTTRAFQKTGMFTSDAEHYRSVMEQLRATQERDLIFCLTMQNHGGYGYDDFRATYGADTPFTNQLSAGAEKVMANYCYLLRQSDAALRELITALQAFDEPTMVVFFGDHLPPFGTDVYAELGIPLAGDNAHRTPYLIWSNQSTLSQKTDLYAYQLGAYALTLAGMNDDPFLSHVEKLRADGTNEDALYDLLSYDALFGKQYAYQEGGLSPANEQFQAGGEMSLSGFDAAALGDWVYLRPRLLIGQQAYKLCVDGQPRDVRRVQHTQEPFTLQCVMTRPNGVRLNASNLLAYQNTEDLLARSGTLAYAELPLWHSGYELVRNHWYQGYAVFQSSDVFEATQSTAVLLGGECLAWQPTYGIGGAGQYALDEEGHLLIALEKGQLAQYGGITPEGARALLEAQGGALVLLED
ncbi:MAG: LTA synthase family protein [Clostridia bacterium]